jgi:hypothetical protein
VVAWPSPSKESCPVGIYSLSATVDPGNLIKDADRSNNQKSITFTILSQKADLKFRPVLLSSGTTKTDIPTLQAPPNPKTLTQPAAGLGRRRVTMDIRMDAATASGKQVGRRAVTLDIGMDAATASSVQVGRRRVTLDIGMDAATASALQVGKRKVVLDIQVR